MNKFKKTTADPNAEDVKEEWNEYVENAVKWNEYRCYSQKVPEGCHELADYLRRFRNEKEIAMDLYKKNCIEYNYAQSCDTAGKLCYANNQSKECDEAYKFMDKGCSLNDGTSCFSAGVYSLSHRDKVSGIKYLEKACDNGHVEGCCMVSGYYIAGMEDVPKEMKKAFKFAKRACDLGSGIGCQNLSVMYKKGVGAEKDLTLALQYRKKAADILGFTDK